ncbi:MAG: hypothetical protein ACJAWV_001805 [Flammeovirgaceae bacterium]|jgi:hypothetical protein
MNKISTLLLATLFMCCFTFSASAQKGKKGKKGKEEVKKEIPTIKKKTPKKKGKSIKKMTKGSKAFKGLFTIYQDTTDGSTYMEVSKEQLEKEFIYFSHIQDGSVFAGGSRGSYLNNDVFTIKKYFNKLEFVKSNTDFYFDPTNALSKSANANISEATMLSAKIEAMDSLETSYLIKADGLFLKEIMTRLKYSSRNPFAFSLGGLSRSKTKYLGFRSYPENTDVSVEYVYDNPSPRNGGGADITDARYVSIKVQHSFLEMPKNDFKPRKDDPRLGYFLNYVTDMTSTDAAPYKDMINRWNLVKAEPNKPLSKPVKPIVWWIENTTPVEFRDAITQGVLAWNKSFAKAGFDDAMVVKVQPDDADWDAGDIRYNVLRWTASPYPPFGGYGPSFTNPRTGEILGADIMLEYVYFTNRVKYTKLYEGAAHTEHELSETEKEIAEALTKNGANYCSFGDHLHSSNLFGRSVIKGFGGKDSDLELKGMTEQSIKELVMHEVGHTLGLMHNMKGSQLYSPAEINDTEKTVKTGLTASVMDYVTINVARDPAKQGHYFSVNVGPYDDWVIEYGYKPAMSDADLDKIASRSSDKTLPFGNDADDMRSPGKAIDPRVMIDDLTNDAVAYSIDRMDLVMDMMKTLQQKYYKEDDTYEELRTGFNILRRQYQTANRVTSRYIGGVYIDRSFQGQEGATKPFTPVPEATQKKAMETLSKYLFAPNAFDVPNEIYGYLQIQRRGFNLFGFGEDYKIHNMVWGMQRDALSHIIHPNTLNRIVDSELYGNEYSISEFMADLNKSIFDADKYGNVNSFRQNLQLEYTKGLIDMIAGKYASRYPYQAKSMALYYLQQNRKIASNNSGDIATKAHKAHVKLLIDQALNTK